MRDKKGTIETEERPNQVERRWSRIEWSKVLKAEGRQRQETCCIEMALERWSCRDSSGLGRVEVGIGRLKGAD